MSTLCGVRSGPLALVGLLALAACGGDAQSAVTSDLSYVCICIYRAYQRLRSPY